MLPKKEKGKVYLLCSCGHKQLLAKGLDIFKEKIFKPIKKVEAADSKNRLAVYKHKCKYCGHNKAELITFEPWYSDEDGIVRYKCGRCGKVEQEEGKVA